MSTPLEVAASTLPTCCWSPRPWDIGGAARAGMNTAWINRTGAPYPAYFAPPHHTVTVLTDLADGIVR
jgi:FMN phosphatase YigB (HAD superfamily)